MKIRASGPITSWQIDGETMETVRNFIFLGSKITVDSDCSHKIKRRLLLGRKAMTNLDNVLKSRDITLPRKVCIVKAMVFPVLHVWMCELDHKEGEPQKFVAFKLWCWRRWLLRVPWTVCSASQSSVTLCGPMDCSTSDFPVLHYLPEFAQIHLHWVSDTVSHLILFVPFSSSLNLSQHQGLFQWVSSLHQVAKVLEFQLQHQSFQWIFRVGFPLILIGLISLMSNGLSRVFSSSIYSLVLSLLYGPTLTSWIIEKARAAMATCEGLCSVT